MNRALAAIVLGVILVMCYPTVAHADDGYVKPPYVCGPVQAPSQVPCDQVPTTTSTTLPYRYCLGYGQQFPVDAPCPKPPTGICAAHPEQYECTDPTRTPAVSDAGMDHTVPTTDPPVAATEPVVSAEVLTVDAAAVVQQGAVQQVSAPPRKHKRTPTTTTTVQPPLYFVLGHWLSYDEFVFTAHLLSGQH